MTIARSIDRMLQEIRLYNGNFGDPIVDLVDFDPIEVLEGAPERNEIVVGAGIALLVEFCSAIDNSDYASVLGTKEHRALSQALSNGWFAHLPHIEQAMRSAFVSEPEFLSALLDVYAAHVANTPSKT